ncbi:MAG: carboxypeptidase-like regulatory domain-containing protein [Bacteroidota bacterium]
MKRAKLLYINTDEQEASYIRPLIINFVGMKSILLVLGLFLFLFTAYASGEGDDTRKIKDKKTVSSMTSLKGIVSDRFSGETLAGVEVSIEGTRHVTYTDFDGTYEFKNIQPGKYSLSFNYISYKTTTHKEITLKGKENIVKTKLKQL